LTMAWLVYGKSGKKKAGLTPGFVNEETS